MIDSHAHNAIRTFGASTLKTMIHPSQNRYKADEKVALAFSFTATLVERAGESAR
jgi:hypothetical protein